MVNSWMQKNLKPNRGPNMLRRHSARERPIKVNFSSFKSFKNLLFLK
uniref:Uncharacterized protein n=1 Tax=Rhizophora mucronata TaxID=61149 RepID=A0A2P2LWJ4_RHIMU